MKKLNSIFAYTSMISAALATGIAIYYGQSFTWQVCTFIWAFVAHTAQQQIDRKDETLMQMRKHLDEILELKTTLDKK